jgi:hypothetical protein
VKPALTVDELSSLRWSVEVTFHDLRQTVGWLN